MSESFCIHCKSQNPSPEDQFCCNGCGLAYKMINNLGLKSYYQTRALDSSQRVLKPEENQKIDITEFVNKQGDVFQIDLMIDGLHCAACVWLIENVLAQQECVTKARINMSSKRLSLHWQGLKEDGNKLIKIIANLGYRLLPFDPEIIELEKKKYDSSLLKALVVAGFAAGNVMLISVALWTSGVEQMGGATRNLLYWISALIALPAIIYCGRVFFASAINSIKFGRVNMDVPIAIAIALTTLVSLFETISKGEHAYFDSVIMLIFFLLIGRYLDFNTRKKAFLIVGDLMMLSGTCATIITPDGSKIIPNKDLVQDMVLLIAMGEKIAADGVIIEGNSEIDTSVITGESVPERMDIGSEVFAGMINLGSTIKVKITQSKEQTLLSKIVKMVEDIENHKGYYQRISDKIAQYYAPIVHILAFGVFVFWCFIAQVGWHQALLNAITILIITCPCALALAVPVAQIVCASKLLKKGILLKDSQALEKLNEIDTIVFDKTGTLTKGKPSLINAYLIKDGGKSSEINNNHELFAMAACLANKSNHILSKALYNSFSGKIINIKTTEIAGLGLQGIYNGNEARLGRREFVLGDKFNTKDKSLENKNLQIYFQYQDQIAVFDFADQLRDDAVLTVQSLKKIGKEIILLSGDQELPVKTTANILGIKQYYFKKTPKEKSDILQKLKNENHNILMIGDGVNDAPSLMVANCSMSLSGASDISKNIADIVFQGNKLKPVLDSIQGARNTNVTIKQNLFLAFAYNAIALPFAAAGFVTPLFAALAMSCSSILVTLNAIRRQ